MPVVGAKILWNTAQLRGESKVKAATATAGRLDPGLRARKIPTTRLIAWVIAIIAGVALLVWGGWLPFLQAVRAG